ncbi:MAG TPA: hypothetical protein VF832_14960 [Longimicrobiales bacterium]
MRSYVAAVVVVVGLVASGSAVRGQATTGAGAGAKHEEMKEKGAHRMAMGGKMATEHNAMMELQAGAIRDARAAARLAGAKKPNRRLVERDAARCRDDLQKVVKHLQEAEGAASTSAEMKEDIGKARGHEEEALKHAEELVTASKAEPLDAGAVKTHADAVVEHARLAQDVMKPHHEKEDEKGEHKAKAPTK